MSGSRAGLAENSQTAHIALLLQRAFDSAAAVPVRCGDARQRTTERTRSGPAQKKEKKHCLHFHRNNMGKQKFATKKITEANQNSILFQMLPRAVLLPAMERMMP